MQPAGRSKLSALEDALEHNLIRPTLFFPFFDHRPAGSVRRKLAAAA
jgi:hypothetical protein